MGSPLPLADVVDRGVVGTLGVRLGTVVVVQGQLVRNSTESKRFYDEPFLLQVDTVDGHTLDKPAVFTRAQMPGVAGTRATVGDRFRCSGYETGSYYGTPAGAGPFSLETAGQAPGGYWFETRFVTVVPH